MASSQCAPGQHQLWQPVGNTAICHMTDFKQLKLLIRVCVYLYLSTVDDEDDDFTLNMVVQLIHNWAQNDSKHSKYDLNSLNQSTQNVTIINKLQSSMLKYFSKFYVFLSVCLSIFLSICAMLLYVNKMVYQCIYIYIIKSKRINIKYYSFWYASKVELNFVLF